MLTVCGKYHHSVSLVLLDTKSVGLEVGRTVRQRLTVLAIDNVLPAAVTFLSRLSRYHMRGGRMRIMSPTGNMMKIVSSKRSEKSNPPRQGPAWGPKRLSRRLHSATDGDGWAILPGRKVKES